MQPEKKVSPSSALAAATALNTLANRQTTPAAQTDIRNSSIVRETVSSTAYVARNAPQAAPAKQVGFNPSINTVSQNIVTVKPNPLEIPKFNQSNQNVIRSELEQAIINAKEPLRSINSNELVNTGPYRGIHLNKREADAYRGPIPIDHFPINNDPNPEVIRKKMDKVQMKQEIAVRYLNPPPAPKPGDLIIRERESNSNVVAPPLIIRQEGARAQTPPPVIYREAPPPLPPQIPEQVKNDLLKLSYLSFPSYKAKLFIPSFLTYFNRNKLIEFKLIVNNLIFNMNICMFGGELSHPFPFLT
jgi:hypothetical protein